ncbi:hypothetical protein C0995_010639 [Termitomyces sp. Mi166|nr:hypothetical protein C0995_010639 [Termitomyces sp. Mi166\
MHCVLIHDNNLSPEVNTVTEFLAYAIRYEQSACTATHYDQHSSRHAQGHCQPVKVGTFLAKHSEIDQNHNLRFVVRRRLSTGQKPVQGPIGNTPVTNKNWHAPRAGQPVQKGQDGPPRALKAQVQAAHTAAASSDAESNVEEEQEELINDEEVPPEMEEPEAEDDTESIYINGDEYVTVDVYENEYYTCEDDEEHLFALTEYQGDTHVQMQCVTLQKAADFMNCQRI